MRVSYFVLATIATLLANVNAKAATAASIDKKRFTVTSPESSETLDGVYVQSGGEEFLILRLGDDTVQSEESPTDGDNGFKSDQKTGSDGQEERGFGLSASTTTKLSKQFSGEYDTFTNKLLWKFFHMLNPRKLPDPPRAPARMRGLP